jgi:transcriptional regulator with XRE-family HTH domain
MKHGHRPPVVTGLELLLLTPGAPTEGELACACGCSPSTISRIKRGQIEPNPRLRKSLAKYFHTTEEWVGAAIDRRVILSFIASLI